MFCTLLARARPQTRSVASEPSTFLARLPRSWPRLGNCHASACRRRPDLTPGRPPRRPAGPLFRRRAFCVQRRPLSTRLQVASEVGTWNGTRARASTGPADCPK